MYFYVLSSSNTFSYSPCEVIWFSNASKLGDSITLLSWIFIYVWEWMGDGKSPEILSTSLHAFNWSSFFFILSKEISAWIKSIYTYTASGAACRSRICSFSIDSLLSSFLLHLDTCDWSIYTSLSILICGFPVANSFTTLSFICGASNFDVLFMPPLFASVFWCRSELTSIEQIPNPVYPPWQEVLSNFYQNNWHQSVI